ncbi:MAG: DUF58 domain-containing protein [Clostridiales bacterium]|jgi:uncharacterized protein (DUF58 family)|nr:DUF58 domain-containing protein [Clostridiales bacterium]
MAILSLILLLAALFAAQNLLYAAFWDASLALRLSFSAARAFEGEKLALTEELTNAKPLPLPWVNAKFQVSRNLVFRGGANNSVSDFYYQNDIFSVGMYERVTRRHEFICRRRGYYRIRSMDIGSSNILVTRKFVKREPCGAELVVYPRLVSRPEIDAVFKRICGDVETRRFASPDPFAFRGIREYAPGDDFRLINFKATAQAGALMSNVHGAATSVEVLILLNVEPYRFMPDEGVLEEGIRVAASIAGHFSELGLPVGLVSNGRDAVTKAPLRVLPGGGYAHFCGVLEQLARVDLAAGQQKMSEILDQTGDPEPVYVLVSSNDDDATASAYERLRGRGLSVSWIIPALARAKLTADGLEGALRWEVKPDNAPPESLWRGLA